MILGIGIDLVEVERIRSACERFGARFLHRILRPEELAYCQSHNSMAPHVAARFAAKEAISKAFGTGIGRELSWLDMEIVRQDSGQPIIVLHDGGLKLLRARAASGVHISLSHTRAHATAVAILEAEPTNSLAPRPEAG